MSCLKILFATYLLEHRRSLRLRRRCQQGRTSAKGRIEYESGNQKDTGNGKTGTVCRDYCRAGDDTAGLSALRRSPSDHHPHPCYPRLDFAGLEKRSCLGRFVRLDQPACQHFHSKPDLLCFQSLLLVGRNRRQRLESCYLLCSPHFGGVLPPTLCTRE